MKIEICLGFRLRPGAARDLVESYVKRTRPVRGITVQEQVKALEADQGSWDVYCSEHGELWSTEMFVEKWQQCEAEGIGRARFCVGGPDGWPGSDRFADRWAFGRVVMAHPLAAAVLAEQLYRMTTILSGHPYHGGHN